jgi:hypothetical protein
MFLQIYKAFIGRTKQNCKIYYAWLNILEYNIFSWHSQLLKQVHFVVKKSLTLKISQNIYIHYYIREIALWNAPYFSTQG